MSDSWQKRKSRLRTLLSTDSDEDAEALALDRILHGQSVIGKTSRTTEIDSLRFSDKDLDVVGTLEYGQFGVIDVVTCKLNGCVYVRKTVEKRFALRTADQCSPQFERDILLRARTTDAEWAPHLLCAFQTPTHLSLVMDYASGGTLWDVLQSSPHDGRVLEADIKWWTPQIVNAIHWCHSQGFCHRDIKPHNFVLNAEAHLLLIDFGTAAPLLRPDADGSQRIAKQHCQVPCGTCDYISPEILQAHENALVALEMEDETSPAIPIGQLDYGRETDWWSMGAMLYEMVYGSAPFFASDIRKTYLKIMEHHKSLRFDNSVPVSAALQDFLRRLLSSAELRLGRCSVDEIHQHPFFETVNWTNSHLEFKPSDLIIPQFTYTTPVPSVPEEQEAHLAEGSSASRAFAFSALFESSPVSAQGASVMPVTPSHTSSRSILRELPVASFIGFSWGPAKDAFAKPSKHTSPGLPASLPTPNPLKHLFAPPTPLGPGGYHTMHATPVRGRFPFSTPMRPSAMTPFRTLPRPSTVQRTAPRRAVSDREAMKQLVDCVGMSARKKVLESGRKPRIIGSVSRSSALKELRFDTSVAVVGDGGVSYKADPPTTSSGSASGSGSLPSAFSMSLSAASQELELLKQDQSTTDAESDLPLSPSPSPRPGSALSLLSRRSQTPTTSSFQFATSGQRGLKSTAEVQQQSVLPENTDAEDADFLSYGSLDHIDRRYTSLMYDLASIEARIRRLSLAANH